jgi:hypothetical protein
MENHLRWKPVTCKCGSARIPSQELPAALEIVGERRAFVKNREANRREWLRLCGAYLSLAPFASMLSCNGGSQSPQNSGGSPF